MHSSKFRNRKTSRLSGRSAPFTSPQPSYGIVFLNSQRRSRNSLNEGRERRASVAPLTLSRPDGQAIKARSGCSDIVSELGGAIGWGAGKIGQEGPRAGFGIYTASKHAVNGLTRSAALELISKGCASTPWPLARSRRQRSTAWSAKRKRTTPNETI